MSKTQVKIITGNQSETFDLLELPDPKSQLIKAECTVIKKDINLGNLVADFVQLNDLIRLAENGAAGRYQIQIQIRDAGRVITRLAGDTSLAIHSFEKASAEVTETLKTVYEYLLSSFEDEALITLTSIEEIAKEMLNTSQKLKNDANDACKRIEEIFNMAREQKGKDEEKNIKIVSKRKEFKTEEKRWKIKKQDIQDDLNNLEDKVSTAVGNIEKAEETISDWADWGIIGAMVPEVWNAKRKSESERKAKQRLFEEQRLQIYARREANEKIATFALKIQQCRDKSVLAETVIKSLDHAIFALCNVEGIMESARIFWQKMYIYCKRLSTENVRQKIANSLEKYDDEDKRQKLYHSYAFKQEAVRVYAKWIAVNETCLGYKGSLKESHENFVKYLKENPSHEQSLAIVKELAIKLKEKTETNSHNLMTEARKVNEQEANLESDFKANQANIKDNDDV